MFTHLSGDAFAPRDEADPRITRVGRYLRRYSLDELPQLLNVLSGEMSMVGPRPEMPFIVEQYGPLERERLRAKPGITGLWQISYARTEEIHKNLDYDIYYVENRSLLLDVVILFLTVFAVVKGTGAH
jgi:lipopolysaccharide/colanic/teichoic acid biosynthesis glycosyltransferase